MIGAKSDGRIVVPTNQIFGPAGKPVLFGGKPFDLLLKDNWAKMVVKNE
jgi:hypothetical protein